LSSTTDLTDFNSCDIVIEAAPEKISIKKHIFAELDRACAPHTILGTNTSCLSVEDIAEATGRGDRVLGIHFFNPVQLMRLVELVKTASTSEGTIEIAKSYAQKLGKTPVISPDTPGFIVNRLLTPFLLEAMRLLQSGQVSKEDMDRAVRLGLNHPMGPLALGDYVGLDTCLSICQALYEKFDDECFAPPELLKKMVQEGELGRKSGKGFYNYTPG
jgi:3-hydroxybutyryl-CoA dehydrogenase